jgi:hypothetical protein
MSILVLNLLKTGALSHIPKLKPNLRSNVWDVYSLQCMHQFHSPRAMPTYSCFVRIYVMNALSLVAARAVGLEERKSTMLLLTMRDGWHLSRDTTCAITPCAHGVIAVHHLTVSSCVICVCFCVRDYAIKCVLRTTKESSDRICYKHSIR